jgi:hypothetical protein
LPRNPVTTSYRKAVPRPRSRSKTIPGLGEPKGLSPLARYLRDNEDAGISAPELIQQFQDYDCEHHWVVLASSVSYVIRQCPDCGKHEKNFKPGEK